MKQIRKLCLAMVVSSLAAFHAHAAPVAMGISTFSFTPGSGYGTDASESAGTLLDAVFSTGGFTAQNFSLGSAGGTFTFIVGTVQLLEPNGQGGIVVAETDNLGVAAGMTFTDPFGSIIELLATSTATTGSVSDSHVDLVIDWNPVQVAFGLGGLLEISLNDLLFTGQQTLTQSATITFLTAPRTALAGQIPEPAALAVPEPATFALLGVGLAGLLVSRKRKLQELQIAM